MKKKSPKQNTVLPTMEVIGALADAFNRSPITIIRWVKSQDDRLTSEKAKAVFRRKTINQEKLPEAV